MTEPPIIRHLASLQRDMVAELRQILDAQHVFQRTHPIVASGATAALLTMTERKVRNVLEYLTGSRL